MEEYIDVKNQAIEDSKTMNFDGVESKEKAALLKLQEKNIEGTKAQMVYVANLLIPDDEEFLNNYSNDKSIDSLIKIYEAPKYVISTKIEELKDRINEIEASKQEEIQEPEIEGESNMEGFNLENTDVTEEIVPENNVTMESFDLKPDGSLEEVSGQKSSNLQETVDALANLGSFIKTNNNQEETIFNLNEEIDGLKGEKEQLIQSNKDKDANINSLEEVVEKFKREQKDLEEELAKKDETIKDLNEENLNKDKTIKNLEEDNNKKDNKIEELSNQNDAQEKEINSLTAAIEEKDSVIAERDETIENNAIQFDTLNKKFLILRDENEAKDREIIEQKKYIAELENVKADYTQLVSTIKEFTASKQEGGPRLAA